jgi:hypothetical protein
MTASRRSGVLACTAVLLGAAAAGCTSNHSSSADHPPTDRPSTNHSVAATTASPTAPDPHAPSVAKSPNLGDEDVKALVSAASLTGSGEYPLKGGIRSGKTLAIAVNCQGIGTLKVTIAPAGITFPLTCIAKQVTPTVNEVRFASHSKDAYIRFTVDGRPKVTWSFAAGWDPHPAQIDNGNGQA